MSSQAPNLQSGTDTSSSEPPEISPLGNHLHPLGKVSVNRPIAPLEACTTYFDAGTVRFGVEHRELNEQIINENFGSDPAALARVVAMHADNGFPEDEGLSLHVFDCQREIEVLRFDMFATDPHYHYMPGSSYHIVVPYDPAASGDMLKWTCSALTNRLPQLLRNGGHEDLAQHLDPELIADALDKVASYVEKIDPPIVGRV
jgi:hypothetical protein